MGNVRSHEKSGCVGNWNAAEMGKKSAANSERNFLWCQRWQTGRKRHLKETLVFDVKGKGGDRGSERTQRRKISWEMVERENEKRKGVCACGGVHACFEEEGECVNQSGRNHYQCWMFVPYMLGQLNRSQAFKVKWKCSWPATCSLHTPRRPQRNQHPFRLCVASIKYFFVLTNIYWSRSHQQRKVEKLYTGIV